MYLKLYNELYISSSLPREPCLCSFDGDHLDQKAEESSDQEPSDNMLKRFQGQLNGAEDRRATAGL